MKNYELDYAQSTHTTCQWSTSVAIMINLYDFMIRDSLVLIITRSSITFFPLGWTLLECVKPKNTIYNIEY